MKHHLFPVAVLLAAAAVVRGDSDAGKSGQLIVHEWGTFTSIAGEDGTAVDWNPQSDPADLPCFVERLRFGLKASLGGTVRMETPVIYFYSPRDMDVNVSVAFRRGILTEWYPKAMAAPSVVDARVLANADVQSTLDWANVGVAAAAAPKFPVDRRSSHYYVARRTDASPLTVGSQTEKFLFYRGVGRFAPPLAAVAAGDQTVVIKSDEGTVGDVMLFENRGGRRSYVAARAGGPKVSLSAIPEGEGSTAEEELRDMLVRHGLFPKEADAMIATWRDSWFEQGTRVFYMVSRKAIDAILPLRISPAPERIERVFVGRMEVVTPAAEREIREAVGRADYALLKKYGRFLDPIVNRILQKATDSDRAAFNRGLRSFYFSREPIAASCN